jgi:hypothetical protein
MGSQRREHVYRMDAPHTGSERASLPPRPGTPERRELAAKVADLHAQGLSYLTISNEIDVSLTVARTLHLEHMRRVEGEQGGGGLDGGTGSGT